MSSRFIIGVDEAGRGPLAGPVSVGVAMVSKDFDWSCLPYVADSKKLTEKRRDETYAKACELCESGVIAAYVAHIDASRIDKDGITHAVRQGIDECFAKLSPDPDVASVKLDGLLKAPDAYTDQETIVHGDDVEPVISLASIFAKVERDAYMRELDAQYPEYGFAGHKGYGTKVHGEAIMQNGLSAVHRRSYCKKYL